MAVILVSILIGGSSIYGLWALRQGQIKHQVSQTPSQEVLGNSSENKHEDSYEQSSASNKEVNILVPDESIVTIHSQPSINSLVLISLNTSRKAKEITRQDIWVKVVLQDPEGKAIEGWVDGDFIEEPEKKRLDSDIKQKPQGGVLESQKMALISDTPTGFLRVRRTPGGQELTKISPGEQFSAMKEESGWVQIILEDGTSGWVSKQYVSF